jgi:competence protein ComEC
MASPVPPPDDTSPKPPEPPWREFARAPLVPVALAATLGLVADHYGDISGFAALAVGLGGLLAWLVGRDRPSAPLWLAVAAAGLAAAHHHSHRLSFDPDDVGRFAPDEPTPCESAEGSRRNPFTTARRSPTRS